MRKKSVLSRLSNVLALSAVTPVRPAPLPVKRLALTLPVMLIVPAPLNVPLKLSLASLRKKLLPSTPSSKSASSVDPVPSLPLCHTVHVVPSVYVRPFVPLPMSSRLAN